MLDRRLRPIKDRVMSSAATPIATRVDAGAVTLLALAVGLAGAVAASVGLVVASLLLWWSSRILDGLDGPVARARRAQSDVGGYVDLVADSVVYAAVVLGVAVAADQRSTWIAAAVLITTFYVNTVSWMFIAATLEKRAARPASTTTSIVMPTGLIEGTETIVLLSLILVAPGAAWWMWAMAVLVAITVLQRTWWARRHLAGPSSGRTTSVSGR